MAHITLIRPALVGSTSSYSSPVTPPLGLAYLAAMLLEKGHQVFAIDAIGEKIDQFFELDGYFYQGLSTDEVIQRIDPHTDVIGVTIMFTQEWPYDRKFLEALRRQFPKTPIIVGGEHITAIPEFSMSESPAIDMCVLGEGEETIVDLVRALEISEDIAAVDGIVFKRGGQFIRTSNRQRIKAVDSIPWPAWDLFPMDSYLFCANALGVYRGRTMPILSTRGCPYQCAFCSNPLMYGNLWVARKPELVLDEIEYYIKKYKAENIDFYDLTMVLKKSWILEFCRLIQERGLNFMWQLPTGTRSEIIDDEVSAALYKTGCRNICYAPESGSTETLKIIKKKVHIPKILESVRVSVSNGISVKCNIIIGFPHERRRNILESIVFSWRLAWMGVCDVAFFIFSAYPGSELFKELYGEKLQNRLGSSYISSLTAYMGLTKTSFHCKHIGARELSFWRFIGLGSFYGLSYLLHPQRLARLVYNIAHNQSDSVIEQRLGAMLRRFKQMKPRRHLGTFSKSNP